MRKQVGFVALGLVLATAGSAQDVVSAESPASRSLAPGSRVRVHMNDATEYLDLPNRVEGRLVAWDAARVVVKDGAGEVAIPAAAIDRVQVPVGRHSRWRAAGLCLLGGAAVGGALGAAITLTDDSDALFAGSAAGAIPFGIIGAAIGFAGGLAVKPAERWETVREPRRRIALQPLLGPRTAGLALHVSF